MGADNVLSIIAVLVAGLSFLFTYCKYRKHDKKLKIQQKRINKFSLKKLEQEEDEEKKAILNIEVIRTSETKRMIKVENIGKSVARKLNFKLLSTKYLEIVTKDLPQEIPPNCSINYSFHKYGYANDNLDVVIKWEDDFKINNTITDTLDIG